MKLELKHLAAYLPYEIQILSKIESKIKHFKFDKCRLKSVNMLSKCVTVIHNVGIDEDEEYITDKNLSDIKLALRPIKDVETFKYKPRYGKEITISQILTIENMENLLLSNIDEIPYAIIDILFKYHFDVFGLISKNLAVDINCC